MADGKTVKIIVDVVAPDGSEKAKRPLRELGAEAKRINAETAASAKQTDRLIAESKRQAVRHMEADIKRLEREEKRAAKSASDAFLKNLKEVQNESKKTSSAFQGAFSGGLVGGIIGGAAFSAFSTLAGMIKDGAAALLNYSGRMQQTQIAFTSLIGNAQMATKHLADIKTFAIQTPFEFEGLAKMSQRLQGANVELAKVIPLMKDIGNIVAATGDITEDRLNGVTNAIAQMIGKQKVSAEEMEQLTERGVQGWNILAQATGKTEKELRKLSEQGKLTSDVMVQALQKISREKFGDAMEKQSQTFQGALSNIKDALLNIASTAFKPLFDEINRFTVDYAKALTDNKGQTHDFGKDTATILTGIISLWKSASEAASNYGLTAAASGGYLPKAISEAGWARTIFGGGLLGEYFYRRGKENTFEILEEGRQPGASLGVNRNTTPTKPLVQIPNVPGEKKTRLSQAGLGEFTDNRLKARFEAALRKLSPSLKAQIFEYADRYGIPTSLALAQLFSESTFNAGAVSPQGALGLTQGMPGTFGQKRFGGFTAGQMKDPKNALSFWGKYMSFLFERYGDWELATLAYHQGEGTVDKLVAVLDQGKSVQDFFKGKPKGKAYVQQIAALSGLRGDGQFRTSLEADPKEVWARRLKGISERAMPDSISSQGGITATVERQLTVEEQHIKNLRTTLGIEENITNLILRQRMLIEEISETYLAREIDQRNELLDIERDLEVLRLQSADAAFSGSRLQLSTQRELLALEREKVELQDRLAGFGENSPIRIQNEALKDQLDLLKKEEDAVTAISRIYLEMSQKGVFSQNQADAKVLDHLNQRIPSVTEAFSDFKITIADGIFQQIDQPFDRLKQKLDSLPPIIKGVASAFLDFANDLVKAFSQKFIMQLLGLGGGGQGGAGFNLGGLFGGGQVTTPGFNPNAAGAITSFGGGSGHSAAIGVGGGLPGGFGNLKNFFGKGGFFGKSGFGFNAGTIGGIGSLAALAGGMVGGKWGNTLSFAGMGASIGSNFGVWGGLIGAGIGAVVGLFSGLFGGSMEKKLKKAASSAYGISIDDKTAKDLKILAKSLNTTDADAVVQSELGRQIIEAHAERTGQSTKRISPPDFGSESYSGNQFGARFGGFDVGNAVRASFSTSADSGALFSTPSSANPTATAALIASNVLIADALNKFTDNFGKVNADDLIMAKSRTIGKAIQEEGQNQEFNEGFDRSRGLHI